MKISGIYRIVNLANGKQYIGSSVDVEKRWKAHVCRLRNNKHHSKYLQNAWNKYAEENFVFELLWKCDPSDCLYEEQLALNNIKCEYNTAIVAGASNTGLKHSDETKKKMSAKLKGRKSPNKGKVFSNDLLLKLSTAQKSAKKSRSNFEHSEEAKKKMSTDRIKKKIKGINDEGLMLFFDSMHDARRAGFSRSSIRRSIKTGIRHRGLQWFYL